MFNVTSLASGYGQSEVIHDINLKVDKQEIVAVMGRNGMGKTTLIRSLMGYVPMAAGSVRWGGRDVTGWPPEKMARLGIGYVPEGRGIFPNLSVSENLVMSARAGVDGSRAWTYDRVLSLFPRLAERLDNGGAQLSGGEQQMLSIGRALMTNPTLMILDEATEGLAPLIVQEIWRVIGQIRETGISTLIVDRNYRMVLAHTDLAVVLEKGRVVLAGESAALAQDHDALGRYLGV